MNAAAIAHNLELLAQRLRHGCGNAGCQIAPPKGLHTNGMCECTPRKFASQLMGLAIECEAQGHRWKKD